ncbi:MAG: hypothetical protein QW199_00635 [Candidatus Pacearchaeota archaeon]
MRELKIAEVQARKALIFDASSIITLNMIGMLELLKELKIGFDGKFLITRDVYNECVNVPIEIKKYELRALMIKKFVEERIIEVINDKELDKRTDQILNEINSIFHVNNEKIKIIHRGEASCIALYELLNLKDKALVIDERTARMILENPESLAKLIEGKVHRKIYINQKIASQFKNKNFKIIRSSEILIIGFEKRKTGFEDNKEGLDALIYGAKAYGCSISEEEIAQILQRKDKL